MGVFNLSCFTLHKKLILVLFSFAIYIDTGSLNSFTNMETLMKFITFLIAIFILSTHAYSNEIIKIEFGKSYKDYSNEDLRERIWRLEQAVWQLQQKVFHLETGKASASAPQVETWVCTVSAMGEKFSATGASKAIAKAQTLEKCKSGNAGSSFHCKNIECEQ
jgi:hypothetical protein